jgi:hypothetical protein
MRFTNKTGKWSKWHKFNSFFIDSTNKNIGISFSTACNKSFDLTGYIGGVGGILCGNKDNNYRIVIELCADIPSRENLCNGCVRRY